MSSKPTSRPLLSARATRVAIRQRIYIGIAWLRAKSFIDAMSVGEPEPERDVLFEEELMDVRAMRHRHWVAQRGAGSVEADPMGGRACQGGRS